MGSSSPTHAPPRNSRPQIQQHLEAYDGRDGRVGGRETQGQSWSDRPRKVRVGDQRACMHARQDQQAMPPVSVSGATCEGSRVEGDGDAQ